MASGRAEHPLRVHHLEREVRIAIHGDDFTCLGNNTGLDWFRKEISQQYAVKFRGRLGPEVQDDKSVRILNRAVEWGQDEIRYEADQRHAEIIIKQLGMSGESKTAVTPGIK